MIDEKELLKELDKLSMKECNDNECLFHNIVLFSKFKRIIKNMILGQLTIDKENPMKKERRRFKMFDAYVCPVCHTPVSKLARYCENCGQALDWSEYNDPANYQDFEGTK